MENQLFDSTFESLQRFQCPDWFRDAKFGIWSHWGPQSVPMCGDWYAKRMYEQGSPQYNYHVRTYGHPSKFGYKDICQLWKAEKFDPEALMDLYHKAGARYFVAQASHHDNFLNYASQINPMNSFQVGPKKDICALWKDAANQFHMPFGLTEHLSASFSWWKTNKGCDSYGPYQGVPYDGNDPAYEFFYHANKEHTIEEKTPWYTSNKKFQQYWLSVMKEMIDKFQPDLLYSDGGLPFGDALGNTHGLNGEAADLKDERYLAGLEAVSYLYNTSIKVHGKNLAVYNQKDRRPEVYKIGILDIEKSQLPDILPEPWQTDSCIGNWFYDKKQAYKKPKQIIEILVDIISKNGSLLLNILQRPDGTIDEEAQYILSELAKWFSICGEGVYGTRPWKVSGEGISRVDTNNGFKEQSVAWTNEDYRFTTKGNAIYAFLLNPDDGGVCVLKSFQEVTVNEVTLLGYGKLQFTQDYGMLIVKLPDTLPAAFVNCLKIS